jgi:hypothetical protein
MKSAKTYLTTSAEEINQSLRDNNGVKYAACQMEDK